MLWPCTGRSGSEIVGMYHGQVVEGMDIIQTIEANPTSRGDAPIKEVVIADCGQIE